MEGLTMELPTFHDNSGLSPQASSSLAKSPIHSEEEESKLSCPSPLVTEPAGKKNPYYCVLHVYYYLVTLLTILTAVYCYLLTVF
jgi:hypothetical protein